MSILKFKVALSGEVSPNGNDPQAADIAMTADDLRYALEQAMQHVIGNGLITGESSATLEDYSIEVSVERQV